MRKLRGDLQIAQEKTEASLAAVEIEKNAKRLIAAERDGTIEVLNMEIVSLRAAASEVDALKRAGEAERLAVKDLEEELAELRPQLAKLQNEVAEQKSATVGASHLGTWRKKAALRAANAEFDARVSKLQTAHSEQLKQITETCHGELEAKAQELGAWRDQLSRITCVCKVQRVVRDWLFRRKLRLTSHDWRSRMLHDRESLASAKVERGDMQRLRAKCAALESALDDVGHAKLLNSMSCAGPPLATSAEFSSSPANPRTHCVSCLYPVSYPSA